MGYMPKGVSPVVASVLLIAFSIAIATIVGTWAMNYTQKQINNIDEKSNCQDVSIQQLDFKYDANSREGIIRIQNSGAANQGYRIYGFTDKDQALLKEDLGPVNKGEIKTLSFQTNLSGTKEIMVEVVGCPTVKLSQTL